MVLVEWGQLMMSFERFVRNHRAKYAHIRHAINWRKNYVSHNFPQIAQFGSRPTRQTGTGAAAGTGATALQLTAIIAPRK